MKGGVLAIEYGLGSWVSVGLQGQGLQGWGRGPSERPMAPPQSDRVAIFHSEFIHLGIYFNITLLKVINRLKLLRSCLLLLSLLSLSSLFIHI